MFASFTNAKQRSVDTNLNVYDEFSFDWQLVDGIIFFSLVTGLLWSTDDVDFDIVNSAKVKLFFRQNWANTFLCLL